MTTTTLDMIKFTAELFWQGEHFNLLADKALEMGLFSCAQLDDLPEDSALHYIPADRLYKLPVPIHFMGHETELVSLVLGNVFLIFRGRLAEYFSRELSLALDQHHAVPRPVGLAGLLDVYCETTLGIFERIADDEVEQLMTAGSIYDDMYYRHEELSDDFYIRSRVMIAYESSRFPGYTLLGTQHTGQLTDNSREQLIRQENERMQRRTHERAAINAEINKPQHIPEGVAPRNGFDTHSRQPFLSESYYNKSVAMYDQTQAHWAANPLLADNPEQENLLRTADIKNASLNGLFIRYTAGAPIAELPQHLEQLISDYEAYQAALASYEQLPKVSPLAIDDWPDQYEECVQVISLCILLQRNDLLKRFTALLDNAGYAGDDTLYEDLLRQHLPERHDIDEWYHALYSPLIRAIYAPTQAEASALLKAYCEQWYAAFEDQQTSWHDSHLEMVDDEGRYVGYWAFEAGAIAFLYGLDDSGVDHMVYPKDLVVYARDLGTATNSAQIGRVASGQPCPKAGYWFTPTQTNSRRAFKLGERMPAFEKSHWMATHWYWVSSD